MISGRRAFAGDTITDVLAAVVREEPDWSALPASTPSHVVALLRKCLQKDPVRRMRDMGDARLELDQPAAVAAPSASGPIVLAARSRSRGERLGWLVAALVTVASIAGIFLLVTFRPRAADAPEYRVEITTPPAPDPISFAVSPDGTSVAFVAQQAGQPRLLLRRLTSVDTRTLEGTEGASLPFWSPDAIPGTDRQQYSVARDGRFLAMVRPDGNSTAQIEIILNWANARGQTGVRPPGRN